MLSAKFFYQRNPHFCVDFATLVQSRVSCVLAALLALTVEPIKILITLDLLISLAYLVICNSLIAIALLLFMIRRERSSRFRRCFFVPPCATVAAKIPINEFIPFLVWLRVAVATIGVMQSRK